MAGGLLYGLYQRRLRRELDGAELPHHVAMIVDGNRRWAKARMLETAAHGHRAGAAKISEFLTWCDDLGIRVVTLYLLSADNLGNRASDELTELFGIIGDVADELSHQRDWKVQHVGATDDLPAGLCASLTAAEERTRDHAGLHVNLAVGYGGRREIADAVRSLLQQHAERGTSLEELAEVIERCRKLMLFSKTVIAVGGPLIVAIMFGAIRFDPAVMIGAITAVIGGTVLLGSNSSTSQLTMAALKAAEQERAELIGGRHFNVELQWNKMIGNALYAPGKATPKSYKEYKIVGKPIRRSDIAPKAFCTEPFVTDVKRPGMVHARTIRPPVAGATGAALP